MVSRLSGQVLTNTRRGRERIPKTENGILSAVMDIRQDQGERPSQTSSGDAVPAAAAGERFGWTGPFLAAVAFVAVFAAFAWQLVVYQRNVRAWSEQDLQSRADLAAIVLVEPLRTLDFKAIQAFGDKCRADGLRLRICHGPAFFGVSENDEGRRGFYDTMGEADIPCLFKVAKSGNYVIGVGRPSFRLLLPFLKAIVVIVLAGLLGITGVVLFFGGLFFVTRSFYAMRIPVKH